MIRTTLLVLNIFLALTAFAGGIGLVANLNAPPLDALKGSPFRDYTIPGLALFIPVGGSALIAAVTTARKHPRSPSISIFAGAMIIGFEIVEIVVIGSPEGIARDLQVLYVTVGLLIAAFAMIQQFRNRAESIKRNGLRK
jgi:hypothetical protein